MRRSAPARRSRAGRLVSGGSPGHQTVTGRSWMTSGMAIAERCSPASPPHVTWIVSAHVSGASSRGIMQCASTRASNHDGPSGSADLMTIVRDGWRPVSSCIVAAQRSAYSGRRAMTTRFITLVRAGTWRPGSPSIVAVRSWPDQIRASSLSISAMLWARRRPAQDGLADPGAAIVGRHGAPQNRRQRRPSRTSSSSAAGGPHVPAS